jgi:hypothetical protein
VCSASWITAISAWLAFRAAASLNAAADVDDAAARRRHREHVVAATGPARGPVGEHDEREVVGGTDPQRVQPVLQGRSRVVVELVEETAAGRAPEAPARARDAT